MSVVKGLKAAAEPVSGAGLRVGICYTRWNDEVIEGLRSGCVAELKKMGVEDIVEKQVAGAYELPFAAKCMIASTEVDAVVCIGCLIKGSTMHFEYICEATSQGIMRVGLDTGVPVIFGVLTCLTDEQALYRAGLTEDGGHNHGPEWATTAVEMAIMGKESGVRTKKA
ncbi:6,7-dimethyl-8-ribityllumazine synthase [Hondaea fermentalgiana]|uniref:6,7-dimethyl-8-ribityllumazine synthase n=1 Tax=Hondaea fermentalgiana TaxID=2315210 RepID=A0A2R5GC48_9STRA|nr:6,7-dimethyl-8-ribityllumazine synthase [Hondaea fermentalgiana]|eukprot:GBG25721.1 6,7-dimethyl-8-ribityllumazine synthase [Hondaea fermentalgiana]